MKEPTFVQWSVALCTPYSFLNTKKVMIKLVWLLTIRHKEYEKLMKTMGRILLKAHIFIINVSNTTQQMLEAVEWHSSIFGDSQVGFYNLFYNSFHTFKVGLICVSSKRFPRIDNHSPKTCNNTVIEIQHLHLYHVCTILKNIPS